MSGKPSKEPLSVRDLMGAADAREASPDEVEPALSDEERRIEVDGVVWRVEEGGRTRSGSGGDSGAPLLRVLFRKVTGRKEGGGDEPGDSTVEDRPDREGITVARALPELPDAALVDLLGRSRPWRSPEAVARGAGPAPKRKGARGSGSPGSGSPGSGSPGSGRSKGGRQGG